MDKRCNGCKVEKPLSGFYNDRNSPDGKDRRCKECKNPGVDHGWRQREMAHADDLLKNGLKECKSCDSILSVDAFYKEASRRLGLSPYCKLCTSKKVSKFARNSPTRKQYEKNYTAEKRFVPNPGGRLVDRKVDQPSYNTMHKRLAYTYGKAGAYLCSNECGSIAADWAYDFSTPQVTDQEGRRYGAEASQYWPLCKSCHKVLDMQVSKGKEWNIANRRRVIAELYHNSS